MVIVGAGNQEREDWRPKGERIGWVDGDDLFLDPESAFAAVQKLARDQATSVPIKQRTLWKRLAEQDHLVSRDRARGTNTVRRTIDGRRLEVIHLKHRPPQSELTSQASHLPKPTSSRPKKVNDINAAVSLVSLGRKWNRGVQQNTFCRMRSVGRSRYEPPYRLRTKPHPGRARNSRRLWTLCFKN